MTRRKFTAKFKTKVVLEVLKERSTLVDLAQKYDIHPTQINKRMKDGSRIYFYYKNNLKF